MNLIITEQVGSVLIIKFNRAEKFNSFNREMALQFQSALKLAYEEKLIRCILITGIGKAFCAGQDLGEAIDINGPGLKTIVEEHYNPIIKLMRNLRKPIVCAVNGVAAGAGANIALAGDIVIACESASFIQAFSKIGLVPDSRGTFFLPRLIGFQKASALMMLGDKVGAKDALEMGMLYKVYPDADFSSKTIELAIKLSEMPTKGLGLTKKLLNSTYQNTLENQLIEEGKEQVNASQTNDYREGVNSFLEKRNPQFKGE